MTGIVKRMIANHRGTSAKDESFPCQTSEGLDYRVGVAISQDEVRACGEFAGRRANLSPHPEEPAEGRRLEGWRIALRT